MRTTSITGRKKYHKNRRTVQICTQCKIAYSLVGLFHTCHSFKELTGKIISEPDLDIRLVLSKSVCQEQERRGCACCSYPCGNQGAKF